MARAKQAMRAAILHARRSRAPAELDDARGSIRDAVLSEVGRLVRRATGSVTIAAYEPLRTEPASTELLLGLAELSRRVFVPLTLDARDLEWLEWGVPAEPLGRSAITEADLVLVPALAVSPDGTRLGRGGGSYDRALRRVRRGVPVVALLFADEVVASLPRAPWDVPVTAVVTPTGWRKVGGVPGP